jgi:hypothetical protein
LASTASAFDPTANSTNLHSDDDDDDDDPDSSDSSSSDDSSDESSNDLSSDDLTSHHRNKKYRNKKRKKSKKKQRSTAKIVFELNKNASYQDFKSLEFHPELEKRQRAFLFFTRKLPCRNFVKCSKITTNFVTQELQKPTPLFTIFSSPISATRPPHARNLYERAQV